MYVLYATDAKTGSEASGHLACPLRKHAYSNILKISPSKTESFQIKILIFFFIFLLKTCIVGTH